MNAQISARESYKAQARAARIQAREQYLAKHGERLAQAWQAGMDFLLSIHYEIAPKVAKLRAAQLAEAQLHIGAN